MTQATLLPDMQAAFRQRLQAFTLPTVAGTFTLAAGQVTLAGAGFAALGFRPGDYGVSSGFADAAHNRRFRVLEAGGDVLRTDIEVSGDWAPTGDFSGVVGVWFPTIAYEDDGFSPINGVPYIGESLSETDNVVRGMGAGLIKHRFLGSLELRYPTGFGKFAISSMAGRLVEHFRPTTNLLYGTAKGLVLAAQQKPVFRDGNWLTCPVEVTIQAWTANAPAA